MLSIKRRLSMLTDEVNLWSDLLKSNEQSIPDSELDPHELDSFELLHDGEPSGVSLGFGMRSLAASMIRLKEVERAANHFWPGNSNDTDRAQHVKAERLIRRLSDYWPEIEHGNTSRWFGASPPNMLEVFDLFCDFSWNFTVFLGLRDPAVTRLFFSVPANYGTRRMEEINMWKERLPPSERLAVISAFRKYLASGYLFPWLPEQEVYQGWLYQIAELGEGNMQKSFAQRLEEQLDEVCEDMFLREEVIQIFTRISDAILQVGHFGKVISSITSDGGQSGPDSMVGSNVPVNIISAAGSEIGCQKILVAFATGKGPRSLRRVLRKVREHLIRCGDSACKCDEPTRAVILFTDLWDPTIFYESLGDFSAHLEGPNAKVIIGALVNGNEVTPQKIFV